MSNASETKIAGFGIGRVLIGVGVLALVAWAWVDIRRALSRVVGAVAPGVLGKSTPPEIADPVPAAVPMLTVTPDALARPRLEVLPDVIKATGELGADAAPSLDWSGLTVSG